MYTLHHYLREIQTMITRFSMANRGDYWLGVAILVFSVAFLIVGFARMVEFSDKGFGPFKRRALVTIHLIGTVVASLAMALFAIDVGARHTQEVGALVGAAFVLLFPIHIYVALIRRIRLRARMEPGQGR